MIMIIIIIPPCLATEKLINPRKNRRNQRIYHVTCPFPFQTLFRNPSSVDSIDDEGDRSEKERREESGNEAVEFARKPGLSYDGVPRGSSLDPLSASTSAQGGLEFTSVSNDYPRQRRYCFPWTGDEREREPGLKIMARMRRKKK